jgi:hypothetical protein
VSAQALIAAPPSRSTRQIAALCGLTLRDTRRLLLDEVERGHLERVGDDRWRATEDFVLEHGAALLTLESPRASEVAA